MKAYHDPEGRVRLFRPDMNMERMITSAKRIALPVRNSILGTYLSLLAIQITDIRWRSPTRAYQGTCPRR
jgi:branched-subunit amino acid aminotransferase/4-amino-4-deoxychorismate lyase